MEKTMTIEERFERIEHVAAGLAEERRKDREEFRALWRDTQRQLNDLTIKVADLGDRVAQTNDTLGGPHRRTCRASRCSRPRDRIAAAKRAVATGRLHRALHRMRLGGTHLDLDLRGDLHRLAVYQCWLEDPLPKCFRGGFLQRLGAGFDGQLADGAVR